MDWNFDLAPKELLHLFFILVLLGESVVSVAHAFMTRKTEEAKESFSRPSLENASF